MTSEGQLHDNEVEWKSLCETRFCLTVSVSLFIMILVDI